MDEILTAKARIFKVDLNTRKPFLFPQMATATFHFNGQSLFREGVAASVSINLFFRCVCGAEAVSNR